MEKLLRTAVDMLAAMKAPAATARTTRRMRKFLYACMGHRSLSSQPDEVAPYLSCALCGALCCLDQESGMAARRLALLLLKT